MLVSRRSSRRRRVFRAVRAPRRRAGFRAVDRARRETSRRVARVDEWRSIVVTARRAIAPTMAPSDALAALLRETPLTTDAWVQCDSCETWRRVPRVVADRLGENTAWFCHQNLDQKFSTCDDAQELEDDEIDALMRAQARGGDEATRAMRTCVEGRTRGGR